MKVPSAMAEHMVTELLPQQVVTSMWDSGTWTRRLDMASTLVLVVVLMKVSGLSIRSQGVAPRLGQMDLATRESTRTVGSRARVSIPQPPVTSMMASSRTTGQTAVVSTPSEMGGPTMASGGRVG